jgi:BRCT domain type II-containing protein
MEVEMNVETMQPLITEVAVARDRADAASAALDKARQEHSIAMREAHQAQEKLHDAIERWIGKRPEPIPCEPAQ